MAWVSTTAKGAASELVASAYLMQGGYHVYRCVAAAAPFDLVAYKDDQCFRVEVKTLYFHPTGPSLPWPSNDQWDKLLVVDSETFRVFEFDYDLPHVIVDKLRRMCGYREALRHPEDPAE